MTTKNLKVLATVAAMLVIVFLILEYGSSDRSTIDPLFPELKSNINNVDSLVIQTGNDIVTVQKAGDEWVVVERDRYAADIGKLREVLLAIADATIIELKTRNPDNYHLIGVNDPAGEASEAVRIMINGDGFEYSIILGATAQTSYRYARVDGDAQSILINQSPDIPGDAGGWLAAELLDIAAERVQQVRITHADGDDIAIDKLSADTANFDVSNIPDGRELSYPTVVNGIATAMTDLSLDDVRAAPDEAMQQVTTTMLQTFDGLQITATVYPEEEASWVSFQAATNETAEAAIQEEAVAINERVHGWQYALPDHKANLLSRRFDDLLKAETTDE